MISRILLRASIAVLLAAITPSAFAAIIASDITGINTSGQSYSYTIDLSGFDIANTTDVTLEITAKGDYGSTINPNSSTAPDEWFTFKLDGTTFADMWGTHRGTNVTYSGFSAITGPTITNTPPATDDFVMTATFSLTDALFQNLAADGEIVVTWQNGPEVDPYHDIDKDGGPDYVQWTLSGRPVPIPGAAWLFMSGLLGIAGLRRKAQSAA